MWIWLVEIPEYAEGNSRLQGKTIGTYQQVLEREKLKEERWLKAQYLET